MGALQPFINAVCESRWGACSCSHTFMWQTFRPQKWLAYGSVRLKLILDKLLFQCYEEVRKSLENCDIITDNNCFVEMKQTGSTPPGEAPVLPPSWFWFEYVSIWKFPRNLPAAAEMLGTIGNRQCIVKPLNHLNFLISSNWIPKLLREGCYSRQKRKRWIRRGSDEKVRVTQCFALCNSN